MNRDEPVEGIQYVRMVFPSGPTWFRVFLLGDCRFQRRRAACLPTWAERFFGLGGAAV